MSGRNRAYSMLHLDRAFNAEQWQVVRVPYDPNVHTPDADAMFTFASQYRVPGAPAGPVCEVLVAISNPAYSTGSEPATMTLALGDGARILYSVTAGPNGAVRKGVGPKALVAEVSTFGRSGHHDRTAGVAAARALAGMDAARARVPKTDRALTADWVLAAADAGANILDAGAVSEVADDGTVRVHAETLRAILTEFRRVGSAGETRVAA